MSDGLTAIHHKNYQLARTKLRQAKALRPESREVNDALAQVDQSIRLSQIETYRRQAVASEQSENWQQALNAYQQVLEVDSALQFAVQGKQRALKHIRIDKRILFFSPPAFFPAPAASEPYPPWFFRDVSPPHRLSAPL